MNKKYDLLHDIQLALTEASKQENQKTYHGKKRSDLKDSDFLFPETRSFPIVTPRDIPDAINNFGRMKSDMSYDSFIKKLYDMAKRKGPEFVDALPEATKQKLNIKKEKASDTPNNERNEEYKPSDTQTDKTEKETELDMLKEQLAKIKKSKGEDFTQVEEMNDETVLQEMMEYKQDFYEMSLGSLRAIASHANSILNSLDSPQVKENLTESWLQGKIAITEDYMRTIHDFLMYVSEAADNLSAADRPGLWENIRKKKNREGKKYKPAKPGDKNRPDPEMWKKLTKDS